LLEWLRQTMEPSTYKQAEIAASKIMELSKERIAAHHREVNEAANTMTGDDTDSVSPFKGKPKIGGAPTMDAAATAAFAKRFPATAKIGTDDALGAPVPLPHTAP
jgi:hypothetical protein